MILTYEDRKYAKKKNLNFTIMQDIHFEVVKWSRYMWGD